MSDARDRIRRVRAGSASARFRDRDPLAGADPIDRYGALGSALIVTILFAQLVLLGAAPSPLAAAAALADCGGAAVVLVWMAPRPGFWRRHADVVAPVLMALLWAALPGLVRAAGGTAGPPPLVPHAAIGAWAGLAGVAACAMAGAVLGERTGVVRLLALLVAGAGLIWATLSLVVTGPHPATVWGFAKGPLAAQFSATLLSPNAAGCAMAMMAVLGAASFLGALAANAERFWRRPDQIGMIAGLVALLVLSGGVVLTRSRAALLLLGVAVALLLLSEAPRLLRARQATLPIAIAALAGPPLLVMLALGDALAEKFGALASDGDGRWMVIRHYAPLTFRRPWFGYGPGSFDDLNAATLDAATAPGLWNFGVAHSAPVQAALNWGWPMVLLIAAAGTAAATAVLRHRRLIARDVHLRAAVLAVLLALGCGAIDIALSLPAIAGMVALLAGAVLGWLRRMTR